MSKLFKRITSAAVAAATVVTMTVAASAATATTGRQDFAGGQAEGFLSANPSSNNCYGETRFYYTPSDPLQPGKLPLNISVSVLVRNLKTTKPYTRFSDTKYDMSYVHVGETVTDGLLVTLEGDFYIEFTHESWSRKKNLERVQL